MSNSNPNYKEYGIELVKSNDEFSACEECIFFTKGEDCPASKHEHYVNCDWDTVWKKTT